MSALVTTHRPSAFRSVADGGRIRRRPGHVVLSARELELLRFLGEQYVARTDQLQALLAISLRSIQRTLAHLEAAGLVVRERPLAGPPWVMATTSGLRACGSPYSPWRPRLGLLPHVAAVNEVRLHVRDSGIGARWICERALVAERCAGEHLPDGLVLLGERRIAVEVELTIKSSMRLEAILDELEACYDDVLYYCTTPVRGRLERLSEESSRM